MSNISSINFQPTTNKRQLSHNDRSTPPYYLLPPEKRIGVECNTSAVVAETLKNTIIQNAMTKYTKSTKQKFKAKSFLWSAVVNIKETTTMQDLEKLAQHFLVKYGFQCYQIAIHRDEGHLNNQGETIINHHAHLEFVTLDKDTGRSLFRDKVRTSKSLSIIQSEVAEILNMERGKPKNDVVNNEGVVIQKGTNLKHLSHFAYRAIKAKQDQDKEIITKELDTAKKSIQNLTQENFKMRGLNDQSVEKYQELLKVYEEQQNAFNQLCETINLNLGKSLKPKEVKQITESAVKNFKVVNSICEALGVSKIYNQDDYINLRKTRDIKFKSVQELLTYIEKLEKDVSIIPTLKTQIEKLKTDNESFKNQTQALEKRVGGLLEDKQKPVASVDTLTKENSSLKSEVNRLNEKIKELEARVTSDNPLYNFNNEKLRGIVDTLTKENPSQKSEVERLIILTLMYISPLKSLIEKITELNGKVTKLIYEDIEKDVKEWEARFREVDREGDIETQQNPTQEISGRGR